VGRHVAVCRAAVEPPRPALGAPRGAAVAQRAAVVDQRRTPRSPLEAEPFHGDARRPGDAGPALVPTSTTQKIIVYVKTEPNNHQQVRALRLHTAVDVS